MFFESTRSVGKNYLYTQTDENLNFVGHVHNSFEFITVTEGQLDCVVYDNRYVLEPGRAMLIMPNRIHRYESPQASKSFLCIFSPDYVIDFYNDVKAAGYVNAVFDFTDNGEIALLRSDAPDKYAVRSVLYGICGKANGRLTKSPWGGGTLKKPIPSRKKCGS